MNCTQLQQLAAAHALGALDRADAARMEAMAAQDPDIRAELDGFLNVVTHLARSVTRVEPPASTRATVLNRIARTPQRTTAAAATASKEPALAGFRFLRPATGQWTEGPMPGARLQVLSADWRRNQVMLYIELDPGTRYPDHTHSGAEEMFLIKGDLLTGGRLMQAGDFVHCDAGSHHEDVVSPSGCQAILITSMTSAAGEIAKAKLKAAGEKLANSLGLGR